MKRTTPHEPGFNETLARVLQDPLIQLFYGRVRTAALYREVTRRVANRDRLKEELRAWEFPEWILERES